VTLKKLFDVGKKGDSVYQSVKEVPNDMADLLEHIFNAQKQIKDIRNNKS
jgi:hypothetical protein